MKKLIPVMALVALMAAPVNAATVKETAKATESAAKRAVDTFVVKPAKAARDAATKMVHGALSLATKANDMVSGGVDEALQTVDGFVTGATGK